MKIKGRSADVHPHFQVDIQSLDPSFSKTAMKKPRLPSWIFYVLFWGIGDFSSAETDITQQLIDEMRGITAELAEGPVLTLPPQVDVKPPPRIITEAGPDFVKALAIWTQVANPVPKPGPTGKSAEGQINAYKNWQRFHDLLERTIRANPPVSLEEYSQYTYFSNDWCGDGAAFFLGRLNGGRTLALLYNEEYSKALENLASSQDPALINLLTAHEIDPEEFAIGRWLGGRSVPDDLCKTGGEKTASMVLKWMEMRWPAEAARLNDKSISAAYGEPYFPRTGVMMLLRNGNQVTDETKSRLSRFIRTDGLRIYPASDWLQNCPKGAERWMTELALEGLGGTLNRTRIKSSAILTAAGIPHLPPELRPPPLYRVFINGELRQSYHLGFSIATEQIQGGSDFKSAGNGLMQSDPDDFFAYGNVLRARLYRFPNSFSKPVSPHDAWLSGSILLPPKFGGINDVHIETTKLTIQPNFPWFYGPAQNDITEVEFGRDEPGRGQHSSFCRYHITGSSPLVIDHVSPGDYWIRVRHPGVTLMERQKISVSRKHNEFNPKLNKGSSLVIPVKWLGDRLPARDDLPISLSRRIDWRRGENTYASILELWKDGQLFAKAGPAPAGTEDLYPESAIFANLPPGAYEIKLPAIEGKGERGERPYKVAPVSVPITIGKSSPSFLISPSITIALTIQ